MSTAVAWAIFLASAGLVYVASTGLARAGDALAARTGVSRTLIGVVLLATATSLPEVATGAAAVALVGSVDLAAGGVFGSNIFNLAIIALMEMFIPRAALLSTVSSSVMLPTLLSGAVIALALVLVVLPLAGVHIPASPLPLASLILLAAYVGSLAWLARRDTVGGGDPEVSDLPADLPSTRGAVTIYLVSTAAVVLGGVGLAEGGDRITEMMGWSTSFVGTLLLAASTSLPEVSTSLAALRLGSRDMAVSNMVGSNLFNTGLIVLILDLLYPGASFLEDISAAHLTTLGIGVAMTAVVAVGIAARPRRMLLGPASPESIVLVTLFLLSHYLTY